MGFAQDTTPVAVRQLDKSDSNIVVDRWDSISAAAIGVGVDPKLIRECLVANAPTAGGFKWDYEDESRRAESHAARDARSAASFAKHGVWRISASGDRTPFASGANAAMELGITHIGNDSVHAMICKCLNGHIGTQYGFSWEYEDGAKRALAMETRRNVELQPKRKSAILRIKRVSSEQTPFDSVADAAKDLNISKPYKTVHSAIYRSLGTGKDVFGYTWERQ